MIAILDYDAGNIRSVEKALRYLGEDPIVTRNLSAIRAADKLILPGVGSFGDAMTHLRFYELDRAIQDAVAAGKPFLGICLGLQLLFASSEESPGVDGLGILDGKICRIPDAPGLKIPHIGWNSLDYPKDGRLFDGVTEGSFVYFVHSFYLKAEDPSIVRATCDYGVTIHASVEKDNIFACQFHPEKSGEVGRQILKNFIAI